MSDDSGSLVALLADVAMRFAWSGHHRKRLRLAFAIALYAPGESELSERSKNLVRSGWKVIESGTPHTSFRLGDVLSSADPAG